MTILVTGATGFVGGVLAEKLLARGFIVRCLARDPAKTERLRKLGAQIIIGDILDKCSLSEAVSGVDIIFHIAAILPNKNYRARDMYSVNYEGTRFLFEAAKINAVKQFIFLSTAFVGWQKNNNSPNELSRCNPSTDYEKSKYKAENYLLENASDAIKVSIIRPGFLYGPGCIGLAPLFASIKRKKYFYIGDGNNLFELTYIDDLMGLLIGIIKDKRAYNEIFIISEENPVSLKEFVSEIAYQLRVDAPRFHIPKIIGVLGSIICQYVENNFNIKLPLNRSALKTLTLSRSFNVMKARNILGYRSKTKLRDGVAKSIEYYKSCGLI
jgi:nucleoside-diphosphate-sugar epimerase